MINAYKIGVELALTGNVARVIADLTRQFETLNTAVKSVQGSLAGMSGDLRNVAEMGRTAARSWTEAANAMGRARASMPGGGGGSGGGGGGFLPGFAGGAFGGFLTGPAGGGGGGFGGGPPRLTGPGGYGGGMPPLNPGMALAGGAAAGAMSSHGYALAAAGYGAIAGGVYTGGQAVLGAAGGVTHLRAMLLAQGVSPANADAAVAAARGLARTTPGITIEHALGAAIDLKSVLGGTHDNPASMGPAMTALPAFTQMMAVLNIAGRQRGDPTYAAARAQELLGHLVDERTHDVSSEALQRNLDAATRVSIATNMRVSPHDYMMFARQARVAGMSLNDDALYGSVPSVMMAQGGSRAGTGMMAMFRQFSTGTMTNNRVEELQRLGILNGRATWQNGRVMTMQRDLKGYDQLVSNPVQWIHDVIMPALARSGVTDRLAQGRAAQSLASTQTGGGFMAEIITSWAAIEKEAANVRAAQTGGAALRTLVDNDYTANTAAFSAAFHNLLTDLGGPLTGDAIAAMRGLSSAMNAIGEFAKEHPDIVRGMGWGAAGVGGAAGLAGTIAAFRLLGGPMAALAGSFTLFAPGTAAASGLASLGALLGRLATLAALPSAILLALDPSNTNGGRVPGSPTSRETDDLERWRRENGHPSLFSSAPVRPVPDSIADRVQRVEVVNGRDLAAGVSREQGEQMSRPSAGTGRRTGRMLPAATPGAY